MKRIACLILTLLSLLLSSRAADDPKQTYISRYAYIAVSEMYRSGVPASITLSQGIIESRAGLSELATKGNNHFGIKCHDWKGKSMKVDDDRKGECFRVYSKASESFRDHSDFLRYRSRYQFLFDYDIRDYKAWAYGLSKAGYATDPQYASKLIKLIEDYGLTRYDSMKLVQMEDKESDFTIEEQDARNTGRKDAAAVIVPSPSVLEEAVRMPSESAEHFNFSLERKVYLLNGVPFVYASEGETYASIAESNNLFLKELLYFNDLRTEPELLPGTVVFLKRKKNKSVKGLDKYVVDEDGESLHEICQRFAVREKSVIRRNGYSQGHQLREGDTIILR